MVTTEPRPVRALSAHVRPGGVVVVALLVAALATFAGPVRAPASAAVPDRFTGTVEEFYEVPDPLPPGAPGELIRVQDVRADAGSTTVRVMYHSRDALERDRAVTGIITFPTGPAPEGGWPVVSLANGTVGMSSRCAPSRRGSPAPTFGVAGVGVVTDYIGLGPVGEIHPYLSRPSEGHSVIDAVRAARNLTEAHAGVRWLAIGGSQGGHGAISANELGESYAPELDLLGSVALAPASMFSRSYGDDLVTRIVGAMMLYGAATEHHEIRFDDYAGPALSAAAASVIPTGCLNEITLAFVPIPADGYYTHDPRVTEPARSVMSTNEVGTVAVDAPLLLLSGTADQIVVIDRTRDLVASLCAVGQVTEYHEVEGATHDDIGVRSATEVRAWLADRVAGLAPETSCAAAPPPPPSTTTTTVAPTTSTTAARAVATVATPAFTG